MQDLSAVSSSARDFFVGRSLKVMIFYGEGEEGWFMFCSFISCGEGLSGNIAFNNSHLRLKVQLLF